MSAEPTDRERRQDSDEDDAAEVGSTGSMDVIHVDTDRADVRSIGYMGKASSVAWAKRTAQESKDSVPTLHGGTDSGFSGVSYHTDDTDIEIIYTADADPYEWPDSNVADRLIHIYFEHCHQALPLIDKIDFMTHYNSFERHTRNLADGETIWLGMMNIVFAISSFFSQLGKNASPEEYFHHLTYFARAKKLLLDHGLLYHDAQVSLTRALGLLSLYYIITGRINRYATRCIIFTQLLTK
jgi:hypothetical protein